MKGRGNTSASAIASPVLVGAVTVLIVIVGVYLAYNANKGLPFVPTYDLKAEIPNGQKLIEGNEIRLGGFLVGIVNKMTPKTISVNGTSKTIAACRHEAEQAGRAPAGRHEGRGAAALRPRPQVP